MGRINLREKNEWFAKNCCIWFCGLSNWLINSNIIIIIIIIIYWNPFNPHPCLGGQWTKLWTNSFKLPEKQSDGNLSYIFRWYQSYDYDVIIKTFNVSIAKFGWPSWIFCPIKSQPEVLEIMQLSIWAAEIEHFDSSLLWFELIFAHFIWNLWCAFCALNKWACGLIMMDWAHFFHILPSLSVSLSLSVFQPHTVHFTSSNGGAFFSAVFLIFVPRFVRSD